MIFLSQNGEDSYTNLLIKILDSHKTTVANNTTLYSILHKEERSGRWHKDPASQNTVSQISNT